MKDHKSKELPDVLTNLMKTGIRAERIAYEMDVAYNTVKSWAKGRRKPKRATVQQIEHLYGVKIL